MGWLSTDAGEATNFLLGRPGYELEFSVNPEAISIEDASINVKHRVLSGRLKKSILNPSMPTIKLSSKYMTPAQRNQLASLSMIDDTFLSFQCRTDWQVVNLRVMPQTVNQVVLPKMSSLNLSKVLVDGGFDSVITIDSITEIPNPTAGGGFGDDGFGDGGFSGPDHAEGATYDDTAYTINLGTAVEDITQPVYVSFTYKGWLVELEKVSTKYQGTNNEWFDYEFQLISA